MSEELHSVDWTLVYSALSDANRREILRYMASSGDKTQIGSIVDHLLSDAETVTEEQRQRVLAQLHHVHLPKFADADILRWDRDAGTVSLRPMAMVLPVGVLSPDRIRASDDSGQEALSD